MAEDGAWEYVPCPACGSEKRQPFFSRFVAQGPRRYNHKIVRCGNCGLLYQNPLCRIDTTKYFASITDAAQEMRQQAITRMNVYLKGIAEIERLNHDAEPWKILDIGCGTGVFMSLARSYGYDVRGVEASAAQVGRAREWLGLNVECSSSLDGLFEPEIFDLATLWDVLEHVEKPREMLLQIHRVLRKGGWLLLKVPNGPHYLAKAKILSRVYPRDFDHMGFGEHLVYYDAKSIGRLLILAGYTSLKIRNGEVELLDGPASLARAVRELKRAMVVMSKHAGNALGCCMGPSLFVTAQKK